MRKERRKRKKIVSSGNDFSLLIYELYLYQEKQKQLTLSQSALSQYLTGWFRLTLHAQQYEQPLPEAACDTQPHVD